MIVYHGTISTCAENILNNGINLSKGKQNVDFGQGFYTTPIKSFAISTAKNKTEKTNLAYGYEFCKPTVLSFELDLKKTKTLKILQFNKCDIKWAQFIINICDIIE